MSKHLYNIPANCFLVETTSRFSQPVPWFHAQAFAIPRHGLPTVLLARQAPA